MRAPSYVWKRGSSFFFQFAIPADLIPILGRTPLRSRLPVTRAADAIRVARVMAMYVEMRSMGKLDKLGKRGGLPLPDRESIVADIDREIRELHSALLDVESGPNAPKRNTPQGELSYQRMRADALAAALRAMSARAVGLAEDWHRDVRTANDKIARYNDENQDLQLYADGMGGDVVRYRNAARSKDAEITGHVTRIASDETLSKLVTEFVGKNSELVEENKKITKRLEYRGPKLSEALPNYEAHMNICGVSQKEIKNLASKLRVFIEISGDKEIASYTLNDLQQFAADLCFIPAGYAVNNTWKGLAPSEIIRKVRENGAPKKTTFLTEKTISTGYIGRVKQALRYLCAANKVTFPYEAYGRVRIPAQNLSAIRHGLDSEIINRVIKGAAEMTSPDFAFMPIVALLTGARISELVYLSPHDLTQSEGVWIFNLTNNDYAAPKRRLKTENSRRFVTLHHALAEIGFIDWARRQKGAFLFSSFHQAKTPHNAASKRFQKLFPVWIEPDEREREIRKAERRYSEVFHALRHTYKDLARSAGIEERTLALQTGHSLQGVALSYGTKATRHDERQKLANMPLPEAWDFAPFAGFADRLALQPRRIRRRGTARKVVAVETDPLLREDLLGL